MTAVLSSEQERFNRVRKWIKRNIVYDYIRAIKVQNSNSIKADPDGCFEKRMGICLDISALAVKLLKEAGIEARMATGWADGQYHAWVYATVDGKTIHYDPTGDILGKKVNKYTFVKWRSA